jgi:hypothetical protein
MHPNVLDLTARDGALLGSILVVVETIRLVLLKK